VKTFRLHSNLLIHAGRRRALTESLVRPLDQVGADPVVVVEDAPFSQERREARRVGKLLFDLLVPSIADVGKALRDADNLMSFGLALHEGDQIDVTVRRDGTPCSRAHENHADEVCTSSAANVSKTDGHDVLVPRLVDRVRLIGRFRDFEEFRVEFFSSRERTGAVRVHLGSLCLVNMRGK
jgi:hypothetical protein